MMTPQEEYIKGETAKLPPGTILAGIVGSTAYGLATEESDLDSLGCFVAPLDDVLGLEGFNAIKATYQHNKPDGAFHELNKYMNLALSANPTVTELLWLNSYLMKTDMGQLLIDARGDLLGSARVRDAYGGYAVQQAKRLVGRQAEGKDGFGTVGLKRTAKHGRHCLRLLRQGRTLLETGELIIDVSPWREELFAAGELASTNPEKFQELFEQELAKLDAVKSVIPETPNRKKASELVIQIRKTLGGIES